MNITYKNFWPSFQDDAEMFEKLFDDEMFEKIDHIEIQSVFQSKSENLRRKFLSKLYRLLRLSQQGTSGLAVTKNIHKSIWFTGENLRPPFPSDFNLSLSFDQDDFSETNVYLPLFYLRLLFPTKASLKNLGVDFSVGDLTKPRESNWEKRAKFACTFINNPEPTRLRAVDAISKLGAVDIYGKYGGRPVKNKFDSAKDYKFMICFENGIYPGYVTEKLLDAYVCGTIPIYWGDLGKNSILNPEAFINYKDFNSLEMLTSHLAQLSNLELEAMSKAPLLLKEPDLNAIRRSIVQALAH